MPYKVGPRTVYRVGECRDLVHVKTLKDLEYQDYTKIQNECIRTNTPFYDPEFDPDDPNYDLIGPVDLTTKTEEHPRWDGKFYWRRPSEMTPEGEARVEFSAANTDDNRRFSKSDISQGGLGDCWYLSSLSLIIEQPELMEFLIPQDNNFNIELGIYHFRFWHKGTYVDVVVDDRIPYWDQDGFGLLTPAFCKIKNNELWPNMLEKAYAKLHRNYYGIEKGWVSYGLEDFTAGVSEMIDLNNKPTGLFEKIKSNFDQGNFMGFNSNFDDSLQRNFGLVKGHAYALVGVEEIAHHSGKVRLIRLRNPWGDAMEWTGDWNDYSEKWNEISAEDKKRLFLKKGDGEFWMDYLDATSTNYFFMIDLCYWYNDLKKQIDFDKWPMEFKKYNGKWIGETAAGCDTIEAIAQNPQYLVRLRKEFQRENIEDCLLIVSLLHKGYVENKAGLPGFGCKVYQVNESLGLDAPFPVEAFSNGQLIDIGYTMFNFEQAFVGGHHYRDLNVVLNLPAAAYLIIPCTQRAGREGDFLLRILSEGNFSTTFKKSAHGSFELGPQGFSEESAALPDNTVSKPTPTPDVSGLKPIHIHRPTPVPAGETEAEKFFRNAAGADKLVSVVELKVLMNDLHKDLKNFDGWSDETVRAIVAVSDYDMDGKLGYKECCELYQKVSDWIALFADMDTNHNGYLSYFQFTRLILYGLKYYLPPDAIQLFYSKYSEKRGVTIDKLILCVSKLYVANRIFEQRKKDNESEVTLSKDKWFTYSMAF